jgi:soluble lytic murein transglycosylase-like protein
LVHVPLPGRKPAPPLVGLLLLAGFLALTAWLLAAESGGSRGGAPAGPPVAEGTAAPEPAAERIVLPGAAAAPEAAPAYDKTPAEELGASAVPEPERAGSAVGVREARAPAVRAGLESPFARAFVTAAKETGLDPALLAAVAKAESEFRPHAVSRAGARGLMQLMPETARRYGADPHDPAQAARAAARYLKDLIAEHGSVEAALRAYNGGPKAADPQAAPAESREFARRVMEEWRAAYLR